MPGPQRYQSQISHLNSEINNHSTDIRAKLKDSRDAVDCYAKLYAFCSQARNGLGHFQSTMELLTKCVNF